ncbi:MAG: UvrD-helicase domain-containing protein [bacterium]|nr:UvrD-helicase domain-containing protein [bacterium]
MQKTLTDIKEREEALHPSRSFIVQAPAGSGKTELLIRRYLTLLGCVDRPEQIIAITFTKKAAAEMHCRIIKSLELAAGAERPLSQHEKKTFDLAQRALKRDKEKGWRLLETPGRLKVQTIDSLCASLTRQMPILSGLGGQPGISEKPEKLYRKAARRTIALLEEKGEDAESIARALKHLDNSFSNLEKRIMAMLARRDQWLRHAKLKQNIDNELLRDYLENSIHNLAKDCLDNIEKQFASDPGGNLINELTAFGAYAAANLIADNKKNAICALASPLRKGAPLKEVYLHWLGVRELLLTGKNELRKAGGVTKGIGFPADKSDEAAGMKQGFQQLLELFEGKDRLLGLLARTLELPELSYEESEWEILNDLLHLLPLAERQLMKCFSEETLVDFQAISAAALESLGSPESPTDLMLTLDLKIQHILVDEYQDTSRTQLQLLEALTRGWEEGDGRTLFVVGDPMQSIYLFREAEVGLFLRASNEGIGNVKLRQLTLRSNFRSQEGIIKWANGTFKSAFPKEEDSFTGSIRYEHFDAVLEPLEGSAANIRIYEGRDDEREAREVAELVSQLKEKHADETIAILARSRSHLGRIINELKIIDIDFKNTDIDPLSEKPVIQDLFSLLRALMHPMDRTAWLAVLRAPWCGMTLTDLHSLCNDDPKSPIWALMNDEARLKKLSPDGRERIASIRGKLEGALPLWGRMKPRIILEGLWIDIGGPACVDDNSMKDGGAFFDMIDQLSEASSINSIEDIKAGIEGLYAAGIGKTDNPVEIITVHKAKGLEYDHVIIPGFGKPPRNQEKPLIHSMERGKDLLLAPIEETGRKKGKTIYNYLTKVRSEKELLELTRLLYVAATRAKKRLYLFGHVKGVDGEEIKTESKSFLSAIKDIIRPDMIEAAPIKDEIKDGIETDTKHEDTLSLDLKRLPSGWKAPEPYEDIEVEIKGRPDIYPEERLEFDWAGEAIKRLGTVLHNYFCVITGDGINSWSIDRLKDEKGRIASSLQALGLSRSDAAPMAREGVDILISALSDPRGRWILDNHSESAAELPLTAIIGGRIVHRVIDRTFVDKEGTRWIIDYKISRHKGSDIDRFLKSEKERYKDQLDGYEKILKNGGETRVIRKGLYYPAQKGWIEW